MLYFKWIDFVRDLVSIDCLLCCVLCIVFNFQELVAIAFVHFIFMFTCTIRNVESLYLTLYHKPSLTRTFSLV